MSTCIIGFRIRVTGVTQAVITPTARNVTNNFDLIGGTLSISRLEGERNVAYRNRLFDVAVHPSGPIYEGVVNGVGRGLGFLREKTIIIDLKTASDGSSIAERPRVDILANKIALYS